MNLYGVKLSTRDGLVRATIGEYTCEPKNFLAHHIEHAFGDSKTAILGIISIKIRTGWSSLDDDFSLELTIPDCYTKITLDQMEEYLAFNALKAKYAVRYAEDIYNLFIAAGLMLEKQINSTKNTVNEENTQKKKTIEKLLWVACTETEMEKQVFKAFCNTNGIDVDIDDMYAALFRCTDGDYVVFTFSNDKTIDELQAEMGCTEEVFEQFKDALKGMFERKDAQVKTVEEIKKAAERSKVFVDKTFSKENIKKAENAFTDLVTDILTSINNLK